MKWQAAVIACVLAGCASRQSAPVVDRTARGAAAPTAPVAKEAAPTPRTLAEDQYEVKKGDTLYSIALEYGVDYRELAQWNSLEDPSKIRVGQVLRTKPEEGRGAQVSKVAISSPVESRPLDAPAKPAAKPAAGPPKPVAAAAATEGFIWPAKGKVIAAFEQTRGKGVDIDGRVGDPIVASAKGKVTYVGSGIRGLGKLLIIQHSDEYLTVYAHTSQILVKEQQVVERGQKVAEIGSSDAERPMLHFQIRKSGRPLDPRQFLPSS
ncbi:MAG: peptidoglycan DD-metalloendopeptidase family protein [Betaproteobacteria bacterium]|nr:peptidoglycan DD-metalloendopeptidase family protein [Betaproteobacteria bacterium]